MSRSSSSRLGNIKFSPSNSNPYERPPLFPQSDHCSHFVDPLNFRKKSLGRARYGHLHSSEFDNQKILGQNFSWQPLFSSAYLSTKQGCEAVVVGGLFYMDHQIRAEKGAFKTKDYNYIGGQNVL